MGKLDQLQPAKVFHYFEEISQIPRRSGNEKALSDHMVVFAKDRGFEVTQDDALNVLIRKPGTPGYENAKAVVLQGHLDMVCEQNAGRGFDFEKDPIDLVIEGEWLTANGTTLGADNGIALAYAMAVLDSEDLAHPPLEVVFTTDEEVGLTGAIKMDKSQLTSAYFINLDSEEEGELTVGCAGGLKAAFHLPVVRTTYRFDNPVGLHIEIKNLKGGHSGVDINDHRANADIILGRVLSTLRDEFSLRVLNVAGGSKDNVIPREALASIVIEADYHDKFKEVFESVVAQVKQENATGDPNMTITAKELVDFDPKAAMSKKTTETLLFTLLNVPNGIQTMSADLEDMVESSLNLGKLAVEDEKIVFLFAVRSNVRSLKYAITRQLKWFADFIGATFIQNADYPEWEFKPQSYLLEKAGEVYEELFGKRPLVKAIHAGLEPGVFLEKLPNIEAISFGPDMEEVHSPNERLHIESTSRTWDYLVALLASLK